MQYKIIAGVVALALFGIGAATWSNSAQAVKACDYYVKTTGDDTKDGTTLATAWRTVQHATDAMTDGKTTCVEWGTYAENVVVTRDCVLGCTVRGDLTVGTPPTLTAGTSTCRADGSKCTLRIGGDHWTFSNFIIEGSKGSHGYTVQVDPGGSYDTVSDSEIMESNVTLVWLDPASDHASILRNRIHDAGYEYGGVYQSDGVYVAGTDHLVANNVIYDNTHSGFGIRVASNDCSIDSGHVIAENTVVNADANLAGIEVGGACDGNVQNVTVRNNVVYYGQTNGAYAVQLGTHSNPADCPIGTVIGHTIWYGASMGFLRNVGGCTYTDEGSENQADPSFINYSGKNFDVNPSSPTIDQADSQSVYSPAISGVLRPQGFASDIGAYEH